MATKGKDEIKETTPISKKLQKLRSESSHIGVVTGSPVINNTKKKKSIKHHTNTHQSSSGDTSSVARKLESDKTTTKVLKNKKKRSSKSLSRGDTSSKTPPQLMLCAHQMDWTNSIVTRTEIRKYPNTDHIDETQEAILPYLLNKFKPNDIKTSFAALISKSNSNTESYYPLPLVKAKLIESFVELILDTKSMMVSSSKKPSR